MVESDNLAGFVIGFVLPWALLRAFATGLAILIGIAVARKWW